MCESEAARKRISRRVRLEMEISGFETVAVGYNYAVERRERPLHGFMVPNPINLSFCSSRVLAQSFLSSDNVQGLVGSGIAHSCWSWLSGSAQATSK